MDPSHLQIIGEAVARLGDFCKAHPQVPRAEIIAMRNILVHEYFGVDLEEIWQTIERDLPALRREIEILLRKLKEEDCGR